VGPVVVGARPSNPQEGKCNNGEERRCKVYKREVTRTLGSQKGAEKKGFSAVGKEKT